MRSPDTYGGTRIEPSPGLVCLPVRIHVQDQIKRAERQFRSIPKHHQNLLPDILSNLTRISQCADQNQELMQAIVHNSLHMFENTKYGERVRHITLNTLPYIKFSCGLYIIFFLIKEVKNLCCVFTEHPGRSSEDAPILYI